MNPLATFIALRMEELGYTRSDVAARMGYSDRGKAFRVFDACLLRGRADDPIFRERLAAALKVTSQQLNEALKQAYLKWAERQAEEQLTVEISQQASFIPHLWAEAERKVPSPIFVVAMCGERRFRETPLPPDLNERSFEQQKALVVAAALAFRRSMNGCAGPFGRITGFEYRYAYGHCWKISVDGEFKEQVHKEWGYSRASLSMGGRDVTGLFEKLLVKESNV